MRINVFRSSLSCSLFARHCYHLFTTKGAYKADDVNSQSFWLRQFKRQNPTNDFFFASNWISKDVCCAFRNRIRKISTSRSDPWKPLRITRSALALHCCKAHARINKKMGKSTPCKIVTLKISVQRFAHVITSGRQLRHTVQISVQIGSVGAKYVKYNAFMNCDFFDCPVLSCPVLFFSILRPGRTVGSMFTLYTWLKRRVSAQGGAFWGLQR